MEQTIAVSRRELAHEKINSAATKAKKKKKTVRMQTVPYVHAEYLSHYVHMCMCLTIRKPSTGCSTMQFESQKQNN